MGLNTGTISTFLCTSPPIMQTFLILVKVFFYPDMD